MAPGPGRPPLDDTYPQPSTRWGIDVLQSGALHSCRDHFMGTLIGASLPWNGRQASGGAKRRPRWDGRLCTIPRSWRVSNAHHPPASHE